MSRSSSSQRTVDGLLSARDAQAHATTISPATQRALLADETIAVLSDYAAMRGAFVTRRGGADLDPRHVDQQLHNQLLARWQTATLPRDPRLREDWLEQALRTASRRIAGAPPTHTTPTATRRRTDNPAATVAEVGRTIGAQHLQLPNDEVLARRIAIALLGLLTPQQATVLRLAAQGNPGTTIAQTTKTSLRDTSATHAHATALLTGLIANTDAMPACPNAPQIHVGQQLSRAARRHLRNCPTCRRRHQVLERVTPRLPAVLLLPTLTHSHIEALFAPGGPRAASATTNPVTRRRGRIGEKLRAADAFALAAVPPGAHTALRSITALLAAGALTAGALAGRHLPPNHPLNADAPTTQGPAPTLAIAPPARLAPPVRATPARPVRHQTRRRRATRRRAHRANARAANTNRAPRLTATPPSPPLTTNSRATRATPSNRTQTSTPSSPGGGGAGGGGGGSSPGGGGLAFGH